MEPVRIQQSADSPTAVEAAAVEAAFRDARFILDMLREPEARIASADERLILDDSNVRRTVTLAIGAHAAGAAVQTSAIIPVWSPYKGEPFHFEIIEAPAGTRQVGHERHLDLSELLLAYRLYSLWRRTAVDDSELERFTAYMTRLWHDLTALPRATPAEGLAIVRTYFDVEQRRLSAFRDDFQTIQTNPQLEHNLCVLARRLASRYFVMLELPTAPSASTTITLSSVESWDQRATSTSADKQGMAKLRSHVGHWLSRRGRHLLPQAESPAELLVHLPWAKKTDRYTLTIDAPPGYFLAKHGIVAARADDRPRIWKPTTGGSSWSTSNSMGRRLHLYAEKATAEGAKLWFGLHVLEQPGRATSRAFAGALVWTLVLIGLAIGASVDGGTSVSSAALIFGALAIFTPFVVQTPGDSLYSLPLLARLVPIATIFSTTAMCLWLIVKSKAPDKPNWAVDLLLDLGWLPSLTVMAFLVGLLYERRAGLRLAYESAITVRYVHNGTIYDTSGASSHA